MSTEPIIVCENLVKIYKIEGLEVQALQGLDLTVDEGEVLGVVGSSGSGKSTLLNILGGLDRPTAGRAWVCKNDILNMNERALNRFRREQVGFVWQQGARNLIPYLTAEENVNIPLLLAGHTGSAARQRAAALLKVVGLADRKHHRMAYLSGGEQQRVAIAVALVNRPRLLLADEPTGELDSDSAQTIYQTFRSLNQEFGLTIVIVSHDPGITRQVDRVVAVRDGKLASETVRVQHKSEEHPGSEKFEELIVLDAAGRLQVPREYLEQYQIQRRASLELTPQGILIRPAPPDGREPNKKTNSPVNDPSPPPVRSAFRRLVGKLSGRRQV